MGPSQSDTGSYMLADGHSTSLHSPIEPTASLSEYTFYPTAASRADFNTHDELPLSHACDALIPAFTALWLT